MELYNLAIRNWRVKAKRKGNEEKEGNAYKFIELSKITKVFFFFCNDMVSFYISNVCIHCYGLNDRVSSVRFSAGAWNFSLHRVQNGSEVHPASYPVGTRGSFPGGKASGV
jgi:hypothetical protein